MGVSQSAYFFYGVHVPSDQYGNRPVWEEGDRIDRIIQALGTGGSGVGHISAGDYDRDELFLCVVLEGESVEVDLGSHVTVTRDTARDPERDAAIATVARTMGYTIGEPGWTVVPDCS